MGWERVEAGAPFRLMAVLEANQENLVVVDVADKRPLATHVPPSLLLVGSLWCSFFSGKRAIIKGPHSSFSISAPSCRRVAKGKQKLAGSNEMRGEKSSYCTSSATVSPLQSGNGVERERKVQCARRRVQESCHGGGIRLAQIASSPSHPPTQREGARVKAAPT